jgi:hypothetical protein
MYLTFASKAALLRQAIQASVQGDEEPTPLSERSERRALVAGSAEEMFARFAQKNAALMTRTAAIIAVGECAASTDPDLAEYRDRAHAATRANLYALATELKRRNALRPGISEQEAADTMYALAADESVFLRLTGECGWTPNHYADLIARTLQATLGTT